MVLKSEWSQRLGAYARLARFDRPVGTFLLLWPTLWSLWLASGGQPSLQLVLIFTLGTVLMRAAGCVINDYADRHLDGSVRRTQHRPLVQGAVSGREAITLACVLVFCAFLLVLMTPIITLALAFPALLLTLVYPLMKRWTHWPQLVLGCAFSWGIPMAWTASGRPLEPGCWLIFAACLLWIVAYDTQYAMVDREDDIKAGIRSTAILFGAWDTRITAALQAACCLLLVLAGLTLGRGMIWHSGIGVMGVFFVRQAWLTRHREPSACFQAFLNNQWAGAALFAATVLDFRFFPMA